MCFKNNVLFSASCHCIHSSDILHVILISILIMCTAMPGRRFEDIDVCQHFSGSQVLEWVFVLIEIRSQGERLWDWHSPSPNVKNQHCGWHSLVYVHVTSESFKARVFNQGLLQANWVPESPLCDCRNNPRHGGKDPVFKWKKST